MSNFERSPGMKGCDATLLKAIALTLMFVIRHPALSWRTVRDEG